MRVLPVHEPPLELPRKKSGRACDNTPKGFSYPPLVGCCKADALTIEVHLLCKNMKQLALPIEAPVNDNTGLEETEMCLP